MSDVEKDLIQKVIVYRLDRFSRSISAFGRLWEILKQHHVEFVSINETFDTSTPMGRAMLNIIMVFAQLERETTAERVRDNYHQRVKLGSCPGGPAPPNRPGRIRFPSLDLEEKKLVAAQFIQKIKLDGDRAEVIWTI